MAKTNTKAVLAVVVMFLSCWATYFLLELVLKEDPGAGNLITFLQFLFIASVGFCTVGKFGAAKRKIPFKKYLIYVGLFWTSSVASKYTFIFNISMPLHMIFGAGSLMANMAMEVWILKKRYPPLKYFAIFMISAGIAICTIQSSGDVKAPRETHEDAAEEEKLKFIDWLWWCFGIAILSSSLFLRARLSIYQETLYSQHGRHPWEVLYYTHLLPLVLWMPSTPNLIHHVNIATQTSTVQCLGIIVPRQVLYLILLIITTAICTSAVYVLSSECTSLAVTLTLTLRKVVSLAISIWYFKNPFTLEQWIGTILVFLGTLIFTEVIQKTITVLSRTKNYNDKIE